LVNKKNENLYISLVFLLQFRNLKNGKIQSYVEGQSAKEPKIFEKVKKGNDTVMGRNGG